MGNQGSTINYLIATIWFRLCCKWSVMQSHSIITDVTRLVTEQETRKKKKQNVEIDRLSILLIKF